MSAQVLQTKDPVLKILDDYLAGHPSKKGSRDNKSIFQSIWSLVKYTSKLCSDSALLSLSLSALFLISNLFQISALPWGTKSK